MFFGVWGFFVIVGFYFCCVGVLGFVFGGGNVGRIFSFVFVN